MHGPESPESLAAALRDATAGLRADPLLAARAIAAARTRVEVERPALVVLAFAATLSLWLAVEGDAALPYEELDDGIDAAESSL
jgi:hypothetical protein